ncbi:hypothetical protein BpHYR1_039443 [Brachionus plicatilis]|uniref:Transmembrane protein n=1 Tax=Brachionus plicatilis TaxID=10195 RepID=A0A3M7S3S7_BRAPC|nr:hypothetical protein BpHYR1_039443 [Brachionus plicatilis]
MINELIIKTIISNYTTTQNLKLVENINYHKLEFDPKYILLDPIIKWQLFYLIKINFLAAVFLLMLFKGVKSKNREYCIYKQMLHPTGDFFDSTLVELKYSSLSNILTLKDKNFALIDILSNQFSLESSYFYNI